MGYGRLRPGLTGLRVGSLRCLLLLPYLLHLPNQRIRTLAGVHLPHLAAALSRKIGTMTHAARRVHRIAPDIVLEFLHTYDASDNGAGVDANTQLRTGGKFTLCVETAPSPAPRLEGRGRPSRAG